MLALSRKIGESIIIDNNVEVVILDIKGDQVKVGIKAPKSVTIYRKELYEQIQASNREAVQSEISFKELENLFDGKDKNEKSEKEEKDKDLKSEKEEKDKE